MVNRARAKGTTWENEVLKDLLTIFGPGVSRAAAGNQSNDFHGPPFPIEAKKRAAWALKDWIRKVAKVTYIPDGPWAIYASDGDKRKVDAIPDVVILPRFFATMLLKHYYEAK